MTTGVLILVLMEDALVLVRNFSFLNLQLS